MVAMRLLGAVNREECLRPSYPYVALTRGSLVIQQRHPNSSLATQQLQILDISAWTHLQQASLQILHFFFLCLSFLFSLFGFLFFPEGEVSRVLFLPRLKSGGSWGVRSGTGQARPDFSCHASQSLRCGHLEGCHFGPDCGLRRPNGPFQLAIP